MKTGDRIRFSKEAIDNRVGCKNAPRTGVMVGESRDGKMIYVTHDGRSSRTPYARQFWEIDTSAPKIVDAVRPAFPVPMVSDGTHVDNVNERGMTLRAYLAAKALQGICANPDCEPEDVRHNAIVALRNANALLEQMESNPNP